MDGTNQVATLAFREDSYIQSCVRRILNLYLLSCLKMNSYDQNW